MHSQDIIIMNTETYNDTNDNLVHIAKWNTVSVKNIKVSG